MRFINTTWNQTGFFIISMDLTPLRTFGSIFVSTGSILPWNVASQRKGQSWKSLAQGIKQMQPFLLLSSQSWRSSCWLVRPAWTPLSASKQNLPNKSVKSKSRMRLNWKAWGGISQHDGDVFLCFVEIETGPKCIVCQLLVCQGTYLIFNNIMTHTQSKKPKVFS